MYSYQRFEAWKRAHQALMLTLKSTDAAYHPRSRALFDQLKRAAISVEANVVEGYALGTVPLFRRHIRIAIGSAAEAETLSRVAEEAKYLDPVVARELAVLFERTLAVLVGLFRSPHALTAPFRATPRR
jgi:four helix bundle protein